ncbi:hypothetical protein CVD28_08945 [Bacillus sp. M6-12]|uniref:hypothetical protein n=1 Tax=Bacillus sp. M6-12 TaxID=2054166 RepID=UPI000C75A068|nr:hypothetical protein [Bacillus sp. M6-12]PLS17816.1 hypothetical protein CVD28_08945 [Bacillus sp. M6-12]
MKPYYIIASLLVIIVAAVLGNKYWNNQVTETTSKAKETMEKPENKERIAEIEKSVGNPSASKSESAPTNVSPNSTTGGSQTIGDVKDSSANNQTQSKDTKISNPGSTNSGKSGNTMISNSGNNTSNLPEQNASSKTQVGSASAVSPTSKPVQKKTLEEVKGSYRSLFGELEAQETSKIDQLVVQAKADYVSKKLSKTEVAAKYQGTAIEMQSSADRSFNILFQQLQSDLEKNGYSLNEAQVFKREYQAKKDERTSRIISQVQGF